jgi:hypothetical protein
MERKYRIVTDGTVFVIELFQSWTYRCGWFFLKKVTQEQWVPCDFMGNDCCDDDGWQDDSEIVEYSSLEEAQAKIEQWTTKPKFVEPVESVWKVVWPKA